MIFYGYFFLFPSYFLLFSSYFILPQIPVIPQYTPDPQGSFSLDLKGHFRFAPTAVGKMDGSFADI
jgi:hypothetical protein